MSAAHAGWAEALRPGTRLHVSRCFLIGMPPGSRSESCGERAAEMDGVIEQFPPEVDSFGAVLRHLRERAGKTLRGLANECGLSASFLSDMEHDRRRLDRGYYELARALGTNEITLRVWDGRLSDRAAAWLRAHPQALALLEKRASEWDGGHRAR